MLSYGFMNDDVKVPAPIPPPWDGNEPRRRPFDQLPTHAGEVVSCPCSSHPFSPLGALAVFLLLITLCACTLLPSPRPEPEPRILDAEQIAYKEADSLWQRGELDQALSHLNRYLGRYPQGRYAPDALLRIGDIYHRRGDLDPAKAFYLRVIEQFPWSPAADEARLALVDSLIQDGRPGEAMKLAGRLVEGDPGPQVRRQLWRRLVQLHDALDEKAHVALYAFSLSKEGPLSEQAQWRELLKETISHLNDSDIERLWDHLDDRAVRGDLMYRYAAIQAMQENDDVALDILTAFRQGYPGHAHEGDAAELIETLSRRLSFEPFTVGCLLPLSGSHEAFGQRALQAIEMALSIQQGGETRLPIRLIVEDTASSEAGAVQAVHALAQARVGAIIGPIVAAPAAAREAQRLKIPLVTFTQRADITQMGDFVFRHFITPQNQVRTLVGHFVNGMGLRDFAVLYPQEPYGRTFMNLFWDEVVRQGGRMVGLIAYDPRQTDFAATIRRLLGLQHPVPADLQLRPVVQVQERAYFQTPAAGDGDLETIMSDPVARLTGLFHQDPDQDRARGPGAREPDEAPDVAFDVLFIPDAPPVAGLILPQLAFHDVKNIYLAGTNLWHSQQLIDMARDYAQSAVMVDGFFKDSELDTVRRFVDYYRDIYGIEPGLVEAFAFDTARLLFELLSQSDIRLRPQLRNALKQVFQMDGVTGPTAFDPNGEAVKALCLLRIQGNRFVEIPGK